MTNDELLERQIAYYRARAEEYDDWFERVGRYDRGPDAKRRWFDEADEVAAALEASIETDDLLEFACGTGIWTERLSERGRRVTAVDASPEMIEIALRRVGGRDVTFERSDLFRWRPSRRYPFLFFGFFLSHVPEARFEDFWAVVGSALEQHGTVFFVDSRYTPESTAVDHRLGEESAGVVTRKLNDGRTFEIVKVFHRADELTRRLAERGWHAELTETENFFLYGTVRRSESTAR